MEFKTMASWAILPQFNCNINKTHIINPKTLCASTAMKPIPHILFYFLVPTTLAVQARKSIQYYGKKIIFKSYLLLLKKC